MVRDINAKREKGEVIALKGREVYVRLGAGEKCSKCGICSSDGKGGMILRAVTDESLKPGDKVYVFLKPAVMIKSAIVLYLLPLVFLVIGYFVGTYVAKLLGVPRSNEALPALFSLGLCGLSFLIIFLYDRAKRNDPDFAPYVKRIIDKTFRC